MGLKYKKEIYLLSFTSWLLEQAKLSQMQSKKRPNFLYITELSVSTSVVPLRLWRCLAVPCIL